jgi:hypothetical protein
MNPREMKYTEIKKRYTISGRTIDEVMNSTINKLIDYYQVNHEYMEDEDKIDSLENIVDLIRIKEYL